MSRRWPLVVLLLLAAVVAQRWQARQEVPDGLPPEVHELVERIHAGGPFRHRQDGAVFENREGRLPPRPRGYYHEYTVETPGSDDRGARRLVTGGTPPGEMFYSPDHYRTFQRLDDPPR